MALDDREVDVIEEGVIAGVVMTFTNVTEITGAEARINKLASDFRDRVHSLETLLDLVPVGIIIVENPDARQAQVNRYGSRIGSVENMTVMSQIRLPLRLFVNDHEMPAEEQPLQRAIRTGESYATSRRACCDRMTAPFTC